MSTVPSTAAVTDNKIGVPHRFFVIASVILASLISVIGLLIVAMIINVRFLRPATIEHDIANLTQFCRDEFADYARSNYRIKSDTVLCTHIYTNTDPFYTDYVIKVFDGLDIWIMGPPLGFRMSSSYFLDPDRIIVLSGQKEIDQMTDGIEPRSE